MDLMNSHVMVVEALQRVCSQDPEVLKTAEKVLREWETQPGFYTVIYNVFSNYSIDVSVRFQAIVYLKIGVDKYWRPKAPNALSEEEKRGIKQGLLSDFTEPFNQIAIQKAAVISKIARMEVVTDEWPQLFPTLMLAVETSDRFVQQRSLLILHQVMKTLAAKRFIRDREIFQVITAKIYKFILNLWNSFTEAFIIDAAKGSAVEVILPNLESALLCLRILRKLSVYGYNKAPTNENVIIFVNAIFARMKATLQCRKQLCGKGIQVLDLCEKYIVHLTKVIWNLLENHTQWFSEFMRPTLELSIYYLFNPEGEPYLFDRFAVACFNFISTLNTEFKSTKNSKIADCVRCTELKKELFLPIMSDLIRKFVSHYLMLKQDELDLWDSDPEAFINDESSETWKYNLRPSIETVFVALFREYRATATPVILEMVRETNYLVPPEDMNGILLKDAVYCAVGLAAYDLYDELDFDQWFTTTIIQELRVKHANYRVLRRRAIALVGKWVGIKLAFANRPLLYGIVIELLSPEEDMAVRLAASTTLRFAIDDFEFSVEQFREYIDPAFKLLFGLLKEANECETKMHVLNVLSLMIEALAQSIAPYTDSLIQYLPLLWEEEHNMLRCAIVSTLVQLVKALGMAGQQLAGFLLPVIRLGTDTTQPAIVYLVEDCLELWLAVLENSTEMSRELMELFDNMPKLLDYSTENLRMCFLISRVHLLLAPELVIQTQGRPLMIACESLFADMKSEGIIMLVRLIETFPKASPALGAECLLPILPRIFYKIIEGEEYQMIMTMYCVIMSRVLLASLQVFSKVLSELARYENETEEATLVKLLDMWLKKMSYVSQFDYRKCQALALCNLLTTRSRPVLEKFSKIMLNVLEVLNDITKTDETGNPVDSLLIVEGQTSSDYGTSDYDESTDNVNETDHDQRKKQLILSDPVHNIVLKDYLQLQLFELRNQTGLEVYQQLVQTIDGDTFTQLKGYITF